jgi:pyruvate ferredoxin oxidoreductase delta subunit
MTEEHLDIYDGEPIDEVNKPGWREIPEGAIILDAGNADRYHTGDWRTERAIWIEKKCIQ